MPGGRLRPQPCVQNKKHASIVTTVTPEMSGIPRAMVLRFPSYSSRRSGFLVSVVGAMRKHCCRLDASVEASEPHDFAVRFRRVRLARQKRPSHPAPNVRDDRDTPLLKRRGMCEDVPVICPSSQANEAATHWHDGQISSLENEKQRPVNMRTERRERLGSNSLPPYPGQTIAGPSKAAGSCLH